MDLTCYKSRLYVGLSVVEQVVVGTPNTFGGSVASFRQLNQLPSKSSLSKYVTCRLVPICLVCDASSTGTVDDLAMYLHH